jgi:hypothetical protein
MSARLAHRRRTVAAALLVAGCGGGGGLGTGGIRTAPGPRVPPPSQLDAVYVLESSGVPADDTVVTFLRARGRVIVLRRGAPDNSLFAEVAIAGDSTASDSATVTVRPQPGLYGVDVDIPQPASGAVRITFSYGVHFVAPSGARVRYGGDLSFEEALSVARVEPDGRVIFLPTTRPGSDMVAAAVGGPGRYVVAAPGAAR